MMETKDNFPNKFTNNLCPICDDGTEDSQEHVLVCPESDNSQIVKEAVKYENLFSNNVNKQMQIASIVTENFRRRKEIEKEKKL